MVEAVSPTPPDGWGYSSKHQAAPLSKTVFVAPAPSCGLIPVEYTVIVELDPVKEKTAGGLILPESTQEIDKISAQEGTLVAASPLAFTYEKWPENSRIPQVGDRVLFKRHAGSIHKREVEGEKREFRLLNDKEIIAIVEKDAG